MPIHEVNIFGFQVSPIFAMVLIAIGVTTVAAKIIDRIFPYSLQRNETLICMLVFVLTLAAMVRTTF